MSVSVYVCVWGGQKTVFRFLPPTTWVPNQDLTQVFSLATSPFPEPPHQFPLSLTSNYTFWWNLYCYVQTDASVEFWRYPLSPSVLGCHSDLWFSPPPPSLKVCSTFHVPGVFWWCTLTWLYFQAMHTHHFVALLIYEFMSSCSHMFLELFLQQYSFLHFLLFIRWISSRSQYTFLLA